MPIVVMILRVVSLFQNGKRVLFLIVYKNYGMKALYIEFQNCPVKYSLISHQRVVCQKDGDEKWFRPLYIPFLPVLICTIKELS